MSASVPSDFMKYYRGYFSGVLRWHQLDVLWETVRAKPEGWYAYPVSGELPELPLSTEDLEHFVAEVDKLLHKEHAEDYCGIVYTDSWDEPAMIKIFDPHNLGSSCGSIGYEVLPRWLLTRIKPEHLNDPAPIPANRKRWWQRIFPR